MESDSKYEDMPKLCEYDLDYLYEGYILAVTKSPDNGNIIETLAKIDPGKTRGNRGVIYCISEHNEPLVVSSIFLDYADFYYITPEGHPEYFI